MNPLKKLSITAAAAIPAVALFAGVASADVQNHVVNGTFNINSKGWTAGPNASIQKHDGFPIGIATNEKFGSGASTVVVSQCVNLHSALEASFEGRVLIPANQDRSGSAGFVVEMYSGDDCTGLKVGEASKPMFTTQTQVWETHAFNLPMGNAPESARVMIAVTKGKSMLNPGADFKTFVDDIKVTQEIPDPVPEGDCQCAEGIGEEPSGEEPPMETEPGAEPAEPEPVVPVAPESREDAEGDDTAPVEPDAPADEPATDEPAAEVDEPASQDDEPAAPAPADSSASDGDGSGEPAPSRQDGNAEDDAPATEAAEEADTSEQYELNADEQHELGRGQATEVPGAPATGVNIESAKDLVGADELGLLGGVLAFFGLVLAAVAVRRERSNN